MFGGIVSECNEVKRLMVKANEGGTLSDTDLEKLIISLHRLGGMLGGLPTGGVEKAIRAASGAVGEPIGTADDKPQRMGLLPPKKTVHHKK